MSGPTAEKDAPACDCESMGGRFGSHRPECPWLIAFEAQLAAESDAGLLRRRTEAEARKCSQAGCPGDGRYQPPGRGHLPDCEHNAVRWVWEEINKPCSCGWDKPLGPKCPDCGGLTVWQDTSVTSLGGSDA